MILSKGLNWVKHIFFVIGIMPALMMFYFIEYVIGLVSSCQWKPLLSLCNIIVICYIEVSGHDYFLRSGGNIYDDINNDLICSPVCICSGRYQLRAGSVLEVTFQMARQRLQVGLAEPLALHLTLLLPLLLIQISL